MGHYARGDSRKMTCSSEEEGYSSQHPSRTNSTMSQMNQRDKRNLILGTFGEAPPLPLPPVSDETDRQFWAEDELSSCESRHFILTRRRRRHSVAYRNRTAVHRSRSGLVQSSSSSTDATRLNGPPVRRRRRFRNCAGTSRVSRTRIASSVQTRINPQTVSRFAAGNNLNASCSIVQSSVPNQRFHLPFFSRQRAADGNEARVENSNPSRTASKTDPGGARRNRVAKTRPRTKSRRNKK